MSGFRSGTEGQIFTMFTKSIQIPSLLANQGLGLAIRVHVINIRASLL